jgi:kynurenine/2-aminoadipate aminotransferase
MILNPGDALLIEKPTYVGALAFLRPLEPEFIEIETDAEGIMPSQLASVLESWPRNKPKPKVSILLFNIRHFIRFLLAQILPEIQLQ